jgi:hypothetical protein
MILGGGLYTDGAGEEMRVGQRRGCDKTEVGGLKIPALPGVLVTTGMLLTGLETTKIYTLSEKWETRVARERTMEALIERRV